MKAIFTIIITTCMVLNAQTAEQIKKQLQDLDLTPEQAKQMARDQGYTDSQIEAEARVRGIDIDGTSKESDIQSVGDLQSELEADESIEKLADEEEDLTLETITATGKDPLDYYGYQIFSADPRAFQASTFGAVDPNYNIGPGDEIIVMLWGESQFRQEFSINREGYVFVPEVGQIFVNGLNLEALEKKFFQILSKVYSTLKPATGKPTTFMDISLGNLRPLRIIVLGEVAQPGAYSVSPSTSLSSSLYYFRGPTTRGSLRDIRLFRKGKLVGNIDFYDYLLSGDTPDDPRLQLDDVVFVPPRGKTVTIRGEVNRQGIYELKETEGLKDLLQIAGNLPVTAYMNRAQITRIVPVDDRSELGMDRMFIDINLNEAVSDKNNIEIHDGDILEIFPIEDFQKNYVTIQSSSIMRPGKYQLDPDMRILDLINAADGLLNNAYLHMAHIIRTKNDLTTELISINIANALAGDLADNIRLQFMDELIIYNKNSLKNIFTNVFITGPVKNPGSFDLEVGEKLSDLIVSAGGFNAGVMKVRITVTRINPDSFNPIIYYFPPSSSKKQYFEISDLDNFENELRKFVLRPNDIINVYADPKDRMTRMVYITGAVFYPGQYPLLNQKEKVSDIINRAGGLLPDAYPMASIFIRKNQTVRLSFEEIINNPNSKENFYLMPNDQIEILQRPNIVQVVGEVNNPGVFKFYNNYSLRDYINIAGGLTVNSQPKEIWITYPDGNSKQLKRFSLSPRVYDGSVITVGMKEETEPFDGTEYAKEVTTILANLAQVLLLYAAVK